MSHAAKSVHELLPLETGGTAARRGFLFQDHVAAGFSLEMLSYGRLRAVWCETLDDVTLIWESKDGQEVEFVQVKAEELDQLWSVARLCQQKAGNPGTSIIERSLANDRCTEPCRFRLVTLRPPQREIEILLAALDSVVRAPGSEAIESLGTTLASKLPGLQSPNGHDLRWWLHRTLWEVGHSESALTDRNRRLAADFVHTSGRFLAPDQHDQFYQFLLLKVKRAADADKSLDRNAGKLSKDELAEWATSQIDHIARGGAEAGGRALQRKLEEAGISPETIESARELRRNYFRRRLQTSYLEVDRFSDWEDRVRARLVMLRESLDAGDLSSGVAFHLRALEELQALRLQTPEDRRPPEELLLGCMYHITDVCQHRFVRLGA